MSILGMSVRAKSAVQRGYAALVRRQEGASAVEYALLVALIAVAVIAAVRLLGNAVSDTFTEAKDSITAN